MGERLATDARARFALCTVYSKKHKKQHTVAIPLARMLEKFSVDVPKCPYLSCHGHCRLAVYENIVRSMSPANEMGKSLLWAHYCGACKAYHQVEDHGHPAVYNKWRFTEDGHFRSAADLKRYVQMHANEVVRSWFGKPTCNFGNDDM